MKLLRSPTVQTAILLTVFFSIKQTLIFLDFVTLSHFTASLPPHEPLWSIPLSTYSHFTLRHLFGNLLFLIIFGYLIEQKTTAVRFHTYFISIGIISALSHLYFSSVIGKSTAIIGASGAVFGLVGYALSSNIVIDEISLSKKQSTVVFILISVVLTVVLGGQESAHIAHFTGILLGLICGHWNLLRE